MEHLSIKGGCVGSSESTLVNALLLEKLFEDDTKIFDKTCRKDSLQKDLDTLYLWSSKWLLKFNEVKCNVKHIRRNNPRNDYKIPSKHAYMGPIWGVQPGSTWVPYGLAHIGVAQMGPI